MPQQLKIPRENPTAEEKMGDYNGMNLVEAECRALEDIEQALKRPVPGYGTKSEYEAGSNVSWRKGQEPCPWLGFVAAGGHVTRLTMNHQELSALPDSIGNLHTLEFLDVMYNRLESLPKSIGALGALWELFLNHNQITALPDSIGDLRSLHLLSISDNRLIELPKSIGSLKSIESLWAEKNQLARLPTSIGQLAQLRDLDLGNNRLELLPEEIGNLRELRSLGVNVMKLRVLSRPLFGV